MALLSAMASLSGLAAVSSGDASSAGALPVVKGSIDSTCIRCWEPDQNPVVAVDLFNPSGSPAEIDVTLDLATDTKQQYRDFSRKVTVPPGDSLKVAFDSLGLLPGFYRAWVTVGDASLKPFMLGFDPTAIVSAPDPREDFGEFWQKALDQLAGVEPEYKLVLDTVRSSAARNVYLVEMKSVPDSVGGEPVVIRGFYTEPVAPGRYPALITYQGYDGGVQDPYWAKADDNPGWVEFYLSTRGQILNNRGENKNPYGDWFASGFGDKDRYYYRGAFMDVVRAIDFVTSREKTDTVRVFSQGQSQGGAFTVVSAALGGGRIKAIAPAVTFLGDYPDYFRIVHWPGEVARRRQDDLLLSDRQMYEFLSYFDTKNFAPMVKCPVYASFGLQDPVCPPHTNFASFNLFDTPDKRYVVQPFIGHWVAPDWYSAFMEFFREVAGDKNDAR